MTGAVHAAIGAALGSLIGKPRVAFAAGVISHIIADALPHLDLTVKQEVTLTGAEIGYIASRYGLGSPEFWGALGAICPDFEHGLSKLGIIPESMEMFPTHVDAGKYHGRETNERVSQLLLFAAATIASELAGRTSSAGQAEGKQIDQTDLAAERDQSNAGPGEERLRTHDHS